MKALLLLLCWCFTALCHILGNFGCGQLTYPHRCSASLLGSLPVLSAHSFASNWQLPFLNQQKGMALEIISWSKVHERMLTNVRIEPWPSAYQVDADPTELPRPAWRQFIAWWFMLNMNHVMTKPIYTIWATSRENLPSVFATRYGSNQPALLQRLARILIFQL